MIREEINYKSLNQKGLTLIELMVTIVIFSIIIGLTLSVLLNTQKTQHRLDKKYEVNTEVNRIIKKIEKALKPTQKLISGTSKRIKFLDNNGDTTEYYLKKNTLFKNDEPSTNLSVDSLHFIYVKIEDSEKTTDFFSLDENGNGVLESDELIEISGIGIYIEFSTVYRSKRVRVEKSFFILLRNLQLL